MRKEFQPDGLSWEDRAKKDELAAVLDPSGSRKKNFYIHSVHIQMLNKALKGLHNGNILDFGCGTGRISRWLAFRGWRVVGVDITTGMLTAARDLTKSTNVSFLRFDGLSLPFRDSSFELVVTVYVLSSIVQNSDSFQLVAAEIHRVLKPGGKLMMIEITDSEELCVEKHKERLTSVGFTLVHQQPVRLRFDRYIALAQRRFVPIGFIPMLGRLGTWECRRKLLRDKILLDWWDNFYEFEKR
jgi:ubiquinone/menaquinone biosynthesis C-methylase UbiE